MRTTYNLTPLARVSGLTLLLALLITAAQAQGVQGNPSTEFRSNFSDDELRSFVNANEKVLDLQLEGEKNMLKAIEDEGLTLERFNAILEEQRDPLRGTETDEKELESFNNAAQAILEENARLERKMTTMIEEEGLDVKTYQEIMLSYQHNPEVKTRINRMVNEGN